MNPKLILTVGASCSGKTTWAEEWVKKDYFNRVNLNRDEARFSLFTDGERDWTKYKFTKANEKKVTGMILEIANIEAQDGLDICISDTNLSSRTRDRWEKWAKENDYDVEYRVFEEDWDTLRQRNQQREGGISESILWDQYMRMRDYLSYETYSCNGKQKGIIVDIDGTVAKVNGRSFFDWDKVDTDLPRNDVIEMVSHLAWINEAQVIFMSGRDGVCYDKTLDWLMEHYDPKSDWDFQLLMREPKDPRKDFIVKKELYNKVKDQYDIDTVFDDRPQVLRLWEELKIPNIINVGGSVHREF